MAPRERKRRLRSPWIVQSCSLFRALAIPAIENFPGGCPLDPPEQKDREAIAAFHRLGIVPQGVVVDTSLTVGGHPDDWLVLPGVFRVLLLLGVAGGKNFAVGQDQ